MLEVYGGRYAVSKTGEVYSLFNHGGNRREIPKSMTTRLANNGYLSVMLFVDTPKGRIKKYVMVHRLVAEAFIPNPLYKPEINHINGNKEDARVENLEWVTKSENAQHAYDTGLRVANKGGTGKFDELHPKSRPVNMLDMAYGFIKQYPSVAAAQREGFSQGNISAVAVGKRQSHKGFRWEYA